MSTIHGVERWPLVLHTDERQTFTEVFRGFPIEQVSYCNMKAGVEKWRHYHRKQTDWWCVLFGKLVLHLHDLRVDSPTLGHSVELTLCATKPEVVRIPSMVAHGCVVGEDGAKLLYATDRVYDPSDEFRIP